MTFHDYYLCASDEAALIAALYDTDETGERIAKVDGDIDLIGTISEQTGTDENGEPVYTPLAGYHANIRARTAIPAGLVDALIIPAPNSPQRVWAGAASEPTETLSVDVELI